METAFSFFFLMIPFFIFITFYLIFRIILGLVHCEKIFYIAFIILIVSAVINPLREFLLMHPVLILQIVGLSIICNGLFLIVNSISFKMHKKNGYYDIINGTVTNVEQRYEFIKHKLNIMCKYYFAFVSYEVDDELCTYCCESGHKKQIYKIKDSFILYQDPKTGKIIEEKVKRDNILLGMQSLFIGSYIVLFTLAIMGTVV